MPALDLLTPLTVKMLGEIPPFLRNDPDHIAVAYAYAREIERLEEHIELVRSQGTPNEATVLLKLWEATVGAEVEPAGVTEAQRQQIVIAFLRALTKNPTGLHWVAVIKLLAGSGLLYIEHIKGHPGSPPANEVRIILPYAASSFWFGTISRLVERVTPAHIKLQIDATEGFILDSSELDKDEMF